MLNGKTSDPKSKIGSSFSSASYNYTLKRLIQSAIYGAVYEGVSSKKTGGPAQRVAIKVLNRELEAKNRDKLQEDIEAEMKFQHDMEGHKNLLTYLETWTDANAIYIVMPYAEYEDLFEVLKKRRVAFTERECRWLFKQILEAAHNLNMKGVAFRDYSVENVLMFKDSVTGYVYPKITDPGQAIRVEYNEKGDVKGLYAQKLFGKCFRPPEIYMRRPYNPVKVDTFCIGWMLFHCLTKRQIFDRAVDSDANWMLLKTGRIQELLRIHNALPLSLTVVDLIVRMLHPDFEKWRYTPKQALGHPWFKGRAVPIEASSIFATPSPRMQPPSTRVPAHSSSNNNHHMKHASNTTHHSHHMKPITSTTTHNSHHMKPITSTTTHNSHHHSKQYSGTSNNNHLIKTVGSSTNNSHHIKHMSGTSNNSHMRTVTSSTNNNSHMKHISSTTTTNSQHIKPASSIQTTSRRPYQTLTGTSSSTRVPLRFIYESDGAGGRRVVPKPSSTG